MRAATKAYTLGLDIGIASVGWCVLDMEAKRIVDLGVRAFDKAETAKEGESLNLVRRSARLMRRRLQRRAWRLVKLTRLLRHEGVIDDRQFFHRPLPSSPSAWQLRVAGLDRLLAREEWAQVLYHLCKHRGFHWLNRAEAKQADSDKKGEGGKVKQGLAKTAALMKEKNYRSAAEMVLGEFPDAQRNKQGDYGKALSRVMLGKELDDLFTCQRSFGNPHTNSEFEAQIQKLFWAQKPALSGEALLKMLGKCTFERTEHRAPKASFSAERHTWLTRLNNLRITVDGTTRPLNDAERQLALPLPYQQAGDYKYKQLRSALTKAGLLPPLFSFNGLRGDLDKAEEAVLIKLPAWHEIRLTLTQTGLKTEWEGIAARAVDGKPEQLDGIAWALSVYKEDEEAEAELQKLKLPGGQKTVEALLDIRFDKFHALSLKALRSIIPHMETGLRYDEACKAAGYHHSQLFVAGTGSAKYLPPLYAARDKDGRMMLDEDMDAPRNPVVLRALNQARKVVNALIRRYQAAPASVHIELARDLSRPFDERQKIVRAQKEYQENNQELRDRFAEHFSRAPRGRELEKLRLYREQSGKCAYSLAGITLNRLLEDGYVEIDHILPYSRSFDDSKNNKVLVLTKENRNKGNRTPYEYLGGAEESERWQLFSAFTESHKTYRLAKRSRLLRKDFGAEAAEGFRERNLNDTRYICRFFKGYVERYLQLHDSATDKACTTINGGLTSFLRTRWGLTKVREESDRHHALDAAVAAACSRSIVKRMSDYTRQKELKNVSSDFVDPRCCRQ